MTTQADGPIAAIDKLVIENEINRLLATYVHYLDDGKFAEIAGMMANASFDVLGDVATGRNEVAAFLQGGVQRHADGTPRTWHALSNILINVDPAGDRAASVSYFTVHQELEGLPLQPIVAGRYHDTFELHGGEWRFATRAIKARLIGDLRFHVATPIDPSKL
jgi:hypothetical protein